MEKEGLDRSATGAPCGTWPRLRVVRAASGLVSALVLGLGSTALAADAACRASEPTISSPVRLERIASKLKRHEPVRILAIGSSSTQGIGASAPTFSYPAQLQADLARIWEGAVTIENAGKGGETISETVVRLEASLAAVKPDLVIWQVGTNDAVKGGDERGFTTLLKQGIDAAQALGIEVLLIDQQYYPAIKDLDQYERFVGLVSATGANEQVPVFSRYKLMKAWGQRSADVLNSMLSSDRFHMGDRGYDCIAELIAHSLHTMATDAKPGFAVTATAHR